MSVIVLACTLKMSWSTPSRLKTLEHLSPCTPTHGEHQEHLNQIPGPSVLWYHNAILVFLNQNGGILIIFEWILFYLHTNKNHNLESNSAGPIDMGTSPPPAAALETVKMSSSWNLMVTHMSKEYWWDLIPLWTLWQMTLWDGDWRSRDQY